MRKKFVLLFILASICSNLSVFNQFFLGNSLNRNSFVVEEKYEIKSSSFWNLTGSPIKIDDLNPNGDYVSWANAALEPWCSGNGSLNNPYIIENITINGESLGNSIEIKDSNRYFIIRNTTIMNSSSDRDNGGIKLENVMNGKLTNNTISFNNRNGIKIMDSQNITISENIIENNGNGLVDGVGISLNGVNCSILNNNIWNSGSGLQEIGIIITGDNNKIFKNNITNHLFISSGHAGTGILVGGVNQKIFKNIIKNNERYGIDWYGNWNNNTISNNIISNNGYQGIHLYGIGGEPTKNTIITNNTISYNQYGVYIHDSEYNYISGNTITDNSEQGIRVYAGHNSNFTNNIIKNNAEDGIFLTASHEIILTNNIIAENSQYGINLFYESCYSNLIYKNFFIDNGINARDNSNPGTNQWNSSTIGNYWSDHIIVDLDKNGIVDSPYAGIIGSAGSIDYLPIYINPDPYFINNPENFSIFHRDRLSKIIWTPIDENGDHDSFWVHLNGVNVHNGTWDGSQIIYSDLSYLNLGVYNFTCFVNDTYGSINSTTLFIVVLFNNIPQFINKSNDFTINLGKSDFDLFWHVIDLDANNHSYWIERNQVKKKQGLWQNDTEINLNEIETLPSGMHNYTCFVNDTTGVIVYSSILIRVNTIPVYSKIFFPSNDVYFPMNDYIFNCTWSDYDGIIQEVRFEFNYHNYTVIENFSGEYTYTLSDLSSNETGYNFRWYAIDNDGAWNSTELKTFRLYKNNSQLEILFNGTKNNYFDVFNPFINITIFNLNKTPGILQLYINNELRQEEIGNSITDIIQLPNGVHNITVILVGDNYTGYTTSWLYIDETTPPDIIFEISDFYVNLVKPEYFHETINISCQINDLSPISWVYFCENSSGQFINQSMINIGNGIWIIAVDISSLDWNDKITFYFYANDTWGNIGKENNLGMLYSIKIYDFQTPTSEILFNPVSGTNIVIKSTLYTIIANDDMGSGISEIKYKINNSNWYDYSIPFNLSTFSPGKYNISYYSLDNAGNIEEILSIIVVLIEPVPRPAIPGYDIILLIGEISVVSIIIIKRKRKHF